MKKKIGLLTFHRPINFGAILQAVALAKEIENCSGKCEIIDYINPAFEKAYPLFHKENCSSIKGIIWEFLMFPYRLKQKREFNIFLKKNVLLTKSYKKADLKNIEKDYDAFLVGSDQVWNLTCSGNDFTYFLDFVLTKPKFSYAASFGDYHIADENKEKIKFLLDSFRDISAREQSGIEVLEEITGKKFMKTLDPTLLLNKEQWFEIIKNTGRIVKENYVLIYFMVQTPTVTCEIFKMANRIREKYGYKIVVIGGSIHKSKNGIIYYNATSPEEFVALFRDASYVLTSSFHGTAFSINFEKDFYSYVKPDLAVQGRIENLLTQIDLNNRMFSLASEIEDIEVIEYSQPHTLLNNEREKSVMYLKRVLSE